MNLKFIGLAVMLLISNTSAINQDKKTEKITTETA